MREESTVWSRKYWFHGYVADANSAQREVRIDNRLTTSMMLVTVVTILNIMFGIMGLWVSITFLHSDIIPNLNKLYTAATTISLDLGNETNFCNHYKRFVHDVPPSTGPRVSLPTTYVGDVSAFLLTYGPTTGNNADCDVRRYPGAGPTQRQVVLTSGFVNDDFSAILTTPVGQAPITYPTLDCLYARDVRGIYMTLAVNHTACNCTAAFPCMGPPVQPLANDTLCSVLMPLDRWVGRYLSAAGVTHNDFRLYPSAEVLGKAPNIVATVTSILLGHLWLYSAAAQPSFGMLLDPWSEAAIFDTTTRSYDATTLSETVRGVATSNYLGIGGISVGVVPQTNANSGATWVIVDGS